MLFWIERAAVFENLMFYETKKTLEDIGFLYAKCHQYALFVKPLLEKYL